MTNRHTDRVRRHAWQRTRRPRHWTPNTHGMPAILSARPVVVERTPMIEDALDQYDEFLDMTTNNAKHVNR